MQRFFQCGLLLAFVQLASGQNATEPCTLTSCTAENNLGGFGSVYVWLSHVLIGFSALSYTVAFGLIIDGASNVAQFHAIDKTLKEKDITTKEKAYAAMAACEDPALKSMLFWLVHLQRTWGCFQTSVGIACWCVVFMVKVKDRAAAHFIIAYLQIAAGSAEASLVWGCPLPDLVVKFGGAKPGSVAPVYEEGKGGFPRPGKDVLFNIWLHYILAAINLGLGACALVLSS